MQNLAKISINCWSLSTSAQYVRIVANMSTFFYLGPIRTNESQTAINAKKSSRK